MCFNQFQPYDNIAETGCAGGLKGSKQAKNKWIQLIQQNQLCYAEKSLTLKKRHVAPIRYQYIYVQLLDQLATISMNVKYCVTSMNFIYFTNLNVLWQSTQLASCGQIRYHQLYSECEICFRFNYFDLIGLTEYKFILVASTQETLHQREFATCCTNGILHIA